MRFFPDLPFSAPPGTVLYIGAGAAEELEQLQQTNAQRIILAEANPDLAQGLEDRFGENPQVEILPVAVGGFTGQGVFHLLNMSEHSSLRQFTGLAEIFPGLREIDKVFVDTYRAHELLEQIQLDPSQSHMLIIDAPGVEEVILQSLIHNTLLERFEHVILRGAADSFYEGSKSAAELLPLLTEAGYRVVEHNDSDPDFPQISLTRDPLQIENRALQSRLTRAETQVHGLKNALDAARARATKAEGAWKATSDTLATTETALTQQKTATQTAEAEKKNLEERLAKLSAENSETTAKLDAARARATKAEGAWKAASDTLATTEAALTQQKTATQTAEAKLSAANQETQALNAELRRQKDATTAFSTRRQEAEAELATTRDRATKAEAAEQALQARLKQREEALEDRELDLGVALRSQAALQADLQALRRTYEALLNDKANQDGLLLQVTTRLNAASSYLHMLNTPPADPQPVELSPPAPEPTKPAPKTPRTRKTSSRKKKSGTAK